ncbi:MAG: type III-B CRISPR module RAMP protein Cmr6 [Candidatus Omnitrophica bacterium]|nr:type III-B CRISPR module RAMP protein Cmr6 [Candidatus Omnitrophota bacterium]
MIDGNGSTCHPGLWLDKFARPPLKQEDKTKKPVQYQEIKQICDLNATAAWINSKPGDGAMLLKELFERRNKSLRELGANQYTFSAKTIGPFTLHLARASALENAGICLHPVYGFAYIPGTALKGMAHAFACEVWLPVQPDKQKACKQICEIFGWASSMPWMSALAKKYPVKAPAGESIGDIVFHDAWPLAWPKLICDIVNNHHPDYYAGKTGKDGQPMPPGDWENPNPVYFLAVAPGTEFDFPLSLRPAAALKNTRTGEESSEALPELAAQWLLGALVHRGAGAKTNVGYGRFDLQKPSASFPELKDVVQQTWEKATDIQNPDAPFREQIFTLELVTPAFLAGAGQEADDCDLRPATLRGHLRWWWRTMHAGYLDAATLKSLEDAIWGSSEEGGAIDIRLSRLVDLPAVLPVPGKVIGKNRQDQDVLRPDADFIQKNGLDRPESSSAKVTQGCLYLSYGMDEMPAGRMRERKRRQCLLPGLRWEVTITARNGFYHKLAAGSDEKPLIIPPGTVLKEASSALWLLCHFGALGSKGRHGFGSLSDSEEGSLESVKQSAHDFRAYCGMKRQLACLSSTPSIDLMLPPIQIDTFWTNYWFVLDQLGFSIQDFAQAKGHKRTWIKEALGLPRKIGVSDNDGTRDKVYRTEWDARARQKVVWLGQKHDFIDKRDAEHMRHASPVCINIRRNLQGHVIHITAFPSPFLPTLATSQKLLADFLKHLEDNLKKRVNDHKDKGQNSPYPSSGQVTPQVVLPKAGESVQAVLLEMRTKKGGWRAQHAATKIEGPVQNSADVPADKKVGDQLRMIVALVSGREIAFRYPTPADEARASKKRR